MGPIHSLYSETLQSSKFLQNLLFIQLTGRVWRSCSQAAAPEVRTTVGHGTVAEQVAVTDGVQVRHSALVISAGAASSSPLAIGAKGVPDPPEVQWVGQFSLSAGLSPRRHSPFRQQEERCDGGQHQELQHCLSVIKKSIGSTFKSELNLMHQYKITFLHAGKTTAITAKPFKHLSENRNDRYGKQNLEVLQSHAIPNTDGLFCTFLKQAELEAMSQQSAI